MKTKKAVFAVVVLSALIFAGCATSGKDDMGMMKHDAMDSSEMKSDKMESNMKDSGMMMEKKMDSEMMESGGM